ncbi:hypothetical protein MKW92_024366, partial [Papaver armeniacum]
ITNFDRASLLKSVGTTLYLPSLACNPHLYSSTRNNKSSFLKKDSSTKCLRYHWLIFEAMRINHTRSSDLKLRMFKEMFLPISVE